MLELQIAKLTKDAGQISPDRRKLLESIAAKILESDNLPALNFICTHNSRRSQLAQVWAKTAAHYAGFSGIECYSGGTEATRVPNATLDALRKQGFIIGKRGDGNEPLSVSYAPDAPELELFSKKFDHPANPDRGFLALMTCSDAADNCPFVPGSNGRFALTYQDPKVSDGTPEEAATYLERADQIGREMIYLFNLLKR
ncbi:protein-tyrosine-phosphatase [Lewinellaceae bacterium SD302]|nr:protein-tyrosine-phosphatase [Lewinellaceae bacterium SD302]